MHHAAPEKEQRGGGIAGGDDLFARLIGPDRSERGEIGQFLVRQSRQQRLFGEFGRLEEIDRAAVTIDHLVFRPFDGGIEQIVVADVAEAFRPFPDHLPFRRRPPDAGQDHGDVVGGEFAEFLGEQAGAGAGHGRDAAQVENDELRPRLGRDLTRDVIDIGKRQRAHQFDHADVLVMRGEDVLFVRAPHAPRRAVADIVIGDDAVARVVAAVEHMQVVMRRQRLADLDAAHAVAVLVEFRRIAAEPEPRGQRRQDAAADAALGGDADRGRSIRRRSHTCRSSS